MTHPHYFLKTIIFFIHHKALYRIFNPVPIQWLLLKRSYFAYSAKTFGLGALISMTHPHYFLKTIIFFIRHKALYQIFDPVPIQWLLLGKSYFTNSAKSNDLGALISMTDSHYFSKINLFFIQHKAVYRIFNPVPMQWLLLRKSYFNYSTKTFDLGALMSMTHPHYFLEMFFFSSSASDSSSMKNSFTVFFCYSQFFSVVLSIAQVP